MFSLENPDRSGFEDWIVAEITAQTGSAPYVYSWKEKVIDPGTGGYVDADPGRTGSTTDSPAYEINDADVDVGTLVFLRVKGASEGTLEYEFSHTAAAAGGSLTVEEADGSPSYSSITTLRFDQADGFVVTNPSAGVARVDITAASSSAVGIVTTTTQTFQGDKTIGGSLTVGVNLQLTECLFMSVYDTTWPTGTIDDGTFMENGSIRYNVRSGTYSSNITIRGIAGGSNGEVICLIFEPSGGSTVTFKDNDSGSAEGSRIKTPNGADYVITGHGAVWLIMANANGVGRWRIIAKV